MSPDPPPSGGKVLHASDHATVIWGDCRDPDVIASVPNGYGLLCTDPPYGVNYRSKFGGNFDRFAGDDGSVDWPAVLGEWVGADGTSRGLRTDRHVYVFGYRSEQLAGPLRLGSTAELVWDKAQPGMGNLSLPWGPSHETITFGTHTKSPSDRARGNGRLSARLRKGSVLRAPRKSRSSAGHPTGKPVSLLQQLIESSTMRGDLVVDPCAGSGSTLVAAVLEGRRAFGVEIDRTYAELAVRRVQDAERIADQMEKC